MTQDKKSIILYLLNKEFSINKDMPELLSEYNSILSVSSTLEGCEDVIILNSTKLTHNWLTRLVDCANSYCNIGTVSPVTSADLIFDDPEIDNKWNTSSLEVLSDIFNYCGDSFYPTVKYNIFDCVYIKRQVLNEVGIPTNEEIVNPDKAFQWFTRATQLGWQHKLCTKVYLYGNLLYDFDKLIYFNRLDKTAVISFDNIKEQILFYFEMNFDNNRKKILHYLLADFQEGTWNNIGGTQLHVHDLVESQKTKYEVFVLARDYDQLRLTKHCNKEIKIFTFYVGKAPDYNIYFDKKHEDIYDYLLKLLKIDIVHIHHTMWMPLNIFYTANHLNIPIILSMHDYYYLCPILKKISPDGIACSPGSCMSDCKSCLKSNKDIIDGAAFIKKWYSEHRKVIKLCTKVVFPSEFAYKAMNEFYEISNMKSYVIEHGITLSEIKRDYTIPHLKMRVAFIGGISDVKGGPVIYDLIKKDNHVFNWYILGGIGYPPLYNLEQKNLVKTGWYKRQDIYEILIHHEIDLICILSTVEETYCYTLSESLAVGIPVVATNVGALGDRMQKLKCGWLVPKNITADELFKLLIDINQNKEEFYKKQKAASTVSVRNLEEMNRSYDELYYNLYSASPKLYSVNISALKNAVYCPLNKSSSVVKNEVNLNEVNLNEVNLTLISAERELNELKSSLLVRIAMKLRKIDIPGKAKLKNLLINLFH